MPSTRILNVDHVLPPRRRPYPPPGDTIPLSFFDVYWINLPPTQRLFLYTDVDHPTLPFPTLLHTLKSSLSETLHLFHPLTGKLTYLPASDTAIIDCSPAAVGDGVAFVVAESDIDVHRLVGEADHDLESFLQLVPVVDVKEFPAAVFAVQVTRFVGGGVAVGYAVHHSVVDGRGVWRFLEAWARRCRGEAAAVAAVHDRRVVRHPRSEEIARRYLRTLLPNLPQVSSSTIPVQNRLHHARRTFMIEPNTIKYLKEAVCPTNTQDPTPPPSTFLALSAHAWTSFAHVKDIKDDETTILIFAADCRARLHPPLDEGYTGNCVRPYLVKATGSELRGAGGLERAFMAIKRAIQDFMKEPLSRCEDWVDEYRSQVCARVMYVVGSPWFKAYEIDFGWGRPSRAELVSMNHDGEVVLLGGREEGQVQASVALSALHMDAFASVFATGWGG